MATAPPSVQWTCHVLTGAQSWKREQLTSNATRDLEMITAIICAQAGVAENNRNHLHHVSSSVVTRHILCSFRWSCVGG